MQFREVNKGSLDSLAKKINNIKLFSKSIKRRHAFVKNATHVQFEDQSNNQSIGQWRSDLPTAEQANIHTPIPAIVTTAEATANLNNLASNVINTTEPCKTNFRGWLML